MTLEGQPAVTRRRLTWWCVLVGLVVGVFVAPGVAARASDGGRVTGDEPQYLMTAISLGEDGTLDIADERADGRYRVFHEEALPQQSALRDDGARISPHDPLLPAVLAVPVRFGGWGAAKFTLALLAGLLAATLTWVAVRRFTVPPVVAALAVLAFALAPPLSVYATQVYPELPAALVVTLAIAALTGSMRRGGVLGLALAVLALPWLSAKYVPVGAALGAVGIALLVRRSEPGDVQRAVLFGGGVMFGALVFLVAHQVVYGGWTAYASGLHFTGGEFSVVGSEPDLVGRSARASGLLFDRSFGLVPWQPAYLLAAPALAALVRRRPAGWVALVAPLAVGWGVATFAALTMHGWSWPGRQVVVILPIVVLSVAWWAGRVVAERPTGRALVRGALAAGLAVGALSTAWLFTEVLSGSATLIVDLESTTQPVVRALGALLPDYRSLGGADELVHVAALVAVALLAVVGWRSVARQRMTVRPRNQGEGTCREQDGSAQPSWRVPRHSSWERAAVTTEVRSGPSATTRVPNRSPAPSSACPSATSAPPTP